MTLLETLLCLAPLISLYEFSTFEYSTSLLAVRYPRPVLFQLIDLSVSHVVWCNSLLLAAFCLGVSASYQAHRMSPTRVLIAATEGLLWGLPLLLIRALSPINPFSLGKPWLLFAGAAFYDELLFQWLLPVLLMTLLSLWMKEQRSKHLSVLLSSLLYAALLQLLRQPHPLALAVQFVEMLAMGLLTQRRGFSYAAYAQLSYAALGSWLLL